jgi:hypothetical protein
MPIRYQYSPVGTMGNLAAQGGLAEYAKAQQARAFEAAQQEDDQNFRQAQALQQMMQQQALQQQAAQNAAAQDWRHMQQSAFNQAQQAAQQDWRQQAMFDRQRQAQGAIDMRLQDRQNFAWQAGGVDEIERDMNRQLSELGKARLSPAGRAKYMGLMKNFNALRAGRLKDNPPLNVYGTRLQEFADSLASSGIEADVAARPRPEMEPVLDPDGKPTGAFWIHHPEGKSEVFQPKKDEAAPIDFSSPEETNKRMEGRIWKDKITGQRWYLDDKGKPSVKLEDSDPASKKEETSFERIKKLAEMRKIAADEISRAHGPAVKGDPDSGPYIPPQEEIDAWIEDQEEQQLSAKPDVEFLRDQLKKNPGALARFNRLKPEEQQEQAKKVRKTIEDQFRSMMGGGNVPMNPWQQYGQPEPSAVRRDKLLGQGMSRQQAAGGQPVEPPPMQDEGAFFEHGAQPVQMPGAPIEGIQQVQLDTGEVAYVTRSEDDYNRLPKDAVYMKNGRRYQKK